MAGVNTLPFDPITGEFTGIDLPNINDVSNVVRNNNTAAILDSISRMLVGIGGIANQIIGTIGSNRASQLSITTGTSKTVAQSNSLITLLLIGAVVIVVVKKAK